MYLFTFLFIFFRGIILETDLKLAHTHTFFFFFTHTGCLLRTAGFSIFKIRLSSFSSHWFTHLKLPTNWLPCISGELICYRKDLDTSLGLCSKSIRLLERLTLLKPAVVDECVCVKRLGSGLFFYYYNYYYYDYYDMSTYHDYHDCCLALLLSCCC